METEFPDKWNYLGKKLAFPYESFKSIDENQKHFSNIEKEEFFSKLNNGFADDKELERTKEIIGFFKIHKREELTKLCLESDVTLQTCVVEKFIKVSVNEFFFKPLFCISLAGYTWQCGLKYTGSNLKTLSKIKILFDT